MPVLPVPHFGNFQSCAGEKKLSSRKKDLPVGKGCRSLSRGYRWLKEVAGWSEEVAGVLQGLPVVETGCRLLQRSCREDGCKRFPIVEKRFPMVKRDYRLKKIALWSGTNKNRDISTGPLARPFTPSLAPLTRSLARDCSLRSRPPLRSLVCSLTHFAHSLARGKVNF